MIILFNIIGDQLWWFFFSGSLPLSNLYMYLFCFDMVNKLSLSLSLSLSSLSLSGWQNDVICRRSRDAAPGNTVCPKKINQFIHFYDSGKQRPILTKFCTNNTAPNRKQIT